MNLQSFKNTCPIIHFQDNLIFNDTGECWGLYRIKNFDYELRKTEEKMSMLYSLSNFIAEAGEQMKLLVIPRVSNNSEKMMNLINRMQKLNMEDEIKIMAKKTVEKQAEYLIEKDEGGVNEYETYLLINLKPKMEVLNFLKGIFTNPKEHLYEFFGVDTFEISKAKLEEYKVRNKDFLRRQLGRVIVQPVDEPEQIEYLIRRAFYRGIETDVEIREGWKPAIIDKGEKFEPFSKDITTLCNGEFEVKNKVITITHENEKGEEEVGYQTFLPVSYVPDNLVFPGNEFFSIVQYLDFPVEICVNMRNIEYEEALKRIERKRKEVRSQIQHIESNDEYVPHSLLDASHAVEELEDDLRSEKSPLMKATITFCVYAKSKDLLKERVGRLKALYKEMKFFLERPISDQELFFMEFLPGTGNYVRDFEIMLTSKTIAGGMPGATTKIGDNMGMYIGYTSNLMRPVFLSLLHACQINKSASAFVWGSLGYGKSFNTNLLVYLHVLNGASAFIVDPKNERKNWAKMLPELAPFTSITTFGSSREDMGKLDPFLIHAEDMNEAANLAMNVIAEQCELSVSNDKYTVLVEAIEKVKCMENPCMELIADVLENFPESDQLSLTAKSLSRMIRTMKKPGLSGLLYGTKDRKKGLSFKNVINIVEINGLQLPMSSKSKESYTMDEKISTVLMLAVANYAKRFAQMDNTKQKIVVMDEAWALAKTEEGKNLFETLARTGRSLNTSTIFIGHSATDIPTDGIRNAITYKFCFNVGNRYEATESLKFLDMELTEDNIRILMSENGLINGECVFSDVYGRKGRLVFDAVFRYLIEAFKTTPEEEVV